jgi:16S rRNA (guanine(966)-N(2))-methyltransferase RsmD
VKVISGKLKGRNIKGYDILGTRPTMDRVKESVFGMIQDYLLNSVVLDLFAGSGNLGIEAISNGANKAYFNDKNKKCLNVIKDNLKEFNVQDDSILTNMDYHEALNYYKNKGIRFDLIFLDPPYKEQIINEILEIIKSNDLLNKNGLVICEFTSKERYLGNDFTIYKERKYGDKEVLIYKLSN